MWEYKQIDIGDKAIEYIKTVEEQAKENWKQESVLNRRKRKQNYIL